jgi:hypothetical protein
MVDDSTVVDSLSDVIFTIDIEGPMKRWVLLLDGLRYEDMWARSGHGLTASGGSFQRNFYSRLLLIALVDVEKSEIYRIL